MNFKTLIASPLFKKIIITFVVMVVILGAVVFSRKTQPKEKLISKAPVIDISTKYGFTLSPPKGTGLVCYAEYMRTPRDARTPDQFGPFCNNNASNTPFVQVGWKAKNLDNQIFTDKAIGIIVNRYLGKGKKFKYVCNNKTGIATIVSAGLGSSAYSCEVTIENGKKFTAIYYLFYIAKEPDVINWLEISDYSKPGTVTNEMMIELAKSMKIVAPSTKATSFLFPFIEKAYAEPDTDGDGVQSGPDAGNAVSDPFSGILGDDERRMNESVVTPGAPLSCAQGTTLTTTNVYSCFECIGWGIEADPVCTWGVNQPTDHICPNGNHSLQITQQQCVADQVSTPIVNVNFSQ